MATTSEVKAGLDAIARTIATAQAGLDTGKARILTARDALTAIPTDFADLIATIDAFTPTGAFEVLAKDEKAKLQTEFLALRATLEGALDALGVSYS